MENNRDEVLGEHKAEAAERRHKHGTLWMASTFILLGIVIALFVRGDFFTGRMITGSALSADDISTQTEKYINENLLTGSPYKAVVNDVTKEDGLFKLSVTIGQQQMTIYSSADGKYLFPSAIDTTEKIEQPTAPAQEEIPKIEKPKMDMFVMSKCPYGVQAENTMLEVVKLLGDKIEYNIHYIANDNGDGTFLSLHDNEDPARGPIQHHESEEDIRQLCIMAKAKDKFHAYLGCLNKDYTNAATAWEQCAKDAGIDVEMVKTCSTGEEGKKLLSEDVKIADAKGVGGSPTIVINGVDYKGSRTAEALKTAMCDAFVQAPAECSQTLSTESATTGGGCGA